MEPSLITTKLGIPPTRPGLVSRPRLAERLVACSGYTLTLVSAPAGFGKTSLLSEWGRRSQPPVCPAWLSLDDSDNDPARFWRYFMAALRMVNPDLGGQALSLLVSPEHAPIQSALTLLLNEINAMPDDLFLVLDDYHFIQAPPVHTGIAFLLEHLPPQMHLVIATRMDPPLPLAHYRGKGTIMEIGAEDLRFTIEETASLMKELKAPVLSSENILALNTRAEGWAVGLKMAVLSMRGEKDVPRFIAEFAGSQRYIMDYLMEEVLERQPQEIQDFLLLTSVLERLHGPLCDALTGRGDGRETLAALEKANMFIVPLDQAREWYRYEHLFAELLRHRLLTVFGSEKVDDLHRSASRWYEENGFVEDSINHSLAGRAWQTAMRLIAEPAVGGPYSRTITGYNWLRLIPEESLLSNVMVTMVFVWSLEWTRRYDEAEKLLKHLEKSAPGDLILKGRIAVARATIAWDKGDFTELDRYAGEVFSLLPPDNAERAILSLVLGSSYVQRYRYSDAEPVLREAYASLRDGILASNASYALNMLGIVSFGRGELPEAERMLKEAIDMPGSTPGARYTAHMYLGLLYLELNDLEKATLEEEKALELSRLAGGRDTDTIYMYQGRVRLARGDDAAAAEALGCADRIIDNRDAAPADLAHRAAYHVEMAAAMGDDEGASRWLDILAGHEPIPVDIPGATLRLFLARMDKATAARRLDNEYQRFSTQGMLYFTAGTLLLQAMLADAPERSIEYLSRALSAGKAIGCVGLFVQQGMFLAPFLRRAISRGIEPEYSRKLLDIIETNERRRKILRGEINSSTTGPLSEREMEVFRLLAAGLDNRQIADKLVISLATAKSHVHHIFGKLGAADRVQAIVRAKELGLI
jgi:LuxR family maltose regulon positive regulatory protein